MTKTNNTTEDEKMNIKKIAAGLMVGALAITSIFTLGVTNISHAAEDEGVPMYRLYNPGNGEHLYTKDSGEKDVLLGKGWSYEGYSWIAANEGEPVYRLFNPYSGEHHYTMDEGERLWLLSSGWNNEGIGWYSRTEGSECEAPVYRLFCPFTNEGLKAHHYTMDENEKNWLLSIGWRYEGEAWISLHNIETTGTIPASCNKEGYSGDAKCKVCDKTYEGSTLPAGHTNVVYVPEVYETRMLERDVTGSCTITLCNLCGAEIWYSGMGDANSILNHFNNAHGYNVHSEDEAIAAGIGNLINNVHLYEDVYRPFLISPAHYHCNTCGADF